MIHLNFRLTQIHSYISIALAASLFSGIVLLSCQKTTRSESTVLIKGTIENPKDDTVSFFIVDTLVKVLLHEGTFTAIIPLKKPSYGRMFYGSSMTLSYFTPNEDFDLSLNTEKFNESQVYVGPGAGPNNYLIAEKLRHEKDPWKKEYWQKNESEFTDFVEERRAAAIHHLEVFSSDHKLPARFIDIEKRVIGLSRANSSMAYVRIRKIDDAEFEVSEDFYSFEDDFDLNDEIFVPVRGLIFDSYLMNLARHHTGSLGKKNQDLMEAMRFFESNITNHKVLDYSLYMIMQKAFKDGLVDDTEEEIMKRFFEKCKDPEYIQRVEDEYAQIEDQSNRYKALVGSPVAAFEFADINGNMVALEDMKGNIVYIDVWATWCGPCLRELPDLEKLQHKFKNDKVSFVSISIDENKSAWKKMVVKKEMKGIHLFDDKEFDSAICKEFVIWSIPRFILIDHEGIIVNPDAPRPSSEEIEPLLNEVLAKII